MSYKTNLTYNKREQLKSQMDDFATFQWRGHDMWEEYGCFIINESKGSLKFYNGPGYSNKYAKSQFSSSVNTLLGIDFKQKTLPMKIGMYWFTIEEYQEFLNEIGPYVVNYLTFNYESNYGYLVKLANITDSPRHVVGTNEDGDYVYYTEMDLTWELLGDNCVRSNLPYEYKCQLNENNTNECTWVFDETYSDMKDLSLLNTPLMFEIPLIFYDDTATLHLQAINNSTNETITQELFNINLRNLTYHQWTLPGKYIVNSLFPDNGYLWNAQYGIVYPNRIKIPLDGSNKNDIKETSSFSENQITIQFIGGFLYLQVDEIEQLLWNGQYCTSSTEKYELNEIEGVLTLTITPIGDGVINQARVITLTTYHSYSNIENSVLNTCYKLTSKYNDMSYDYVVAARSTNNPFDSISYLLINSNNLTGSTFTPTTITSNNEILLENYTDLHDTRIKNGLTLIQASVLEWDNSEIWSQFLNTYQMLLRYDSETGLIYIQEGDNDAWHLLNFQVSNNNGEYILSAANIKKWKIPGLFAAPELQSTDWQFKLTTTNVDLNLLPQHVLNTSITIYSRKNII